MCAGEHRIGAHGCFDHVHADGLHDSRWADPALGVESRDVVDWCDVGVREGSRGSSSTTWGCNGGEVIREWDFSRGVHYACMHMCRYMGTCDICIIVWDKDSKRYNKSKRDACACACSVRLNSAQLGSSQHFPLRDYHVNNLPRLPTVGSPSKLAELSELNSATMGRSATERLSFESGSLMRWVERWVAWGLRGD